MDIRASQQKKVSWRYSPVEVPHIRFIVRVLDIDVWQQRQVPMGSRTENMGGASDSVNDSVMDTLALQQRQASWCILLQTVETPGPIIGQGRWKARCCATTSPHGPDSPGFPVLTVLKTVEVPQLQHIDELVAEFKVKDMGLVFCTRGFFFIYLSSDFWSSIEKRVYSSQIEFWGGGDAGCLTPKCSAHVRLVARLWLHRVIVVVIHISGTPNPRRKQHNQQQPQQRGSTMFCVSVFACGLW